MKHSEPEFVIKWREHVEAARNIPKCCHTCDHYAADGQCIFHWAQPPADFAASIGACGDWIERMPF